MEGKRCAKFPHPSDGPPMNSAQSAAAQEAANGPMQSDSYRAAHGITQSAINPTQAAGGIVAKVTPAKGMIGVESC